MSRWRIAATSSQPRSSACANGGRQLLIAELAAHADERHHGAAACLASLPLDHLLPYPVIALGPSALCSPLRQRLRSAQRAGLPFQHIEIMFQIEDLLRTTVAAFMLAIRCRGGGTRPCWNRRGLRRSSPASAARSRSSSAPSRILSDRHAGS